MDYSAQRYVPKGAIKVANKSGSAVAYLFGTQSAKGFVGKAKNPAFNYSFASPTRRAEFVAKFLRDADSAAQRRAADVAEKKAKLAKPTALQVGDVLSCVWGYDQTNVEYFEITKLVGARTVEIRKIASMSEETGFMSGQCVPTKGAYVGEPMRKKVNENDRVRIYSFASASKVEPVKVAGVSVFMPQGWTAYA